MKFPNPAGIQKIIRTTILIGTVLIAPTGPVLGQVRENPYDCFGKTLSPFLNLFRESKPESSLQATLIPELPALKAAPLPEIRIQAQNPDWLLIETKGPHPAPTAIFFNSPNGLWIDPALQPDSSPHELTDLSSSRGFRFRLPFPEKNFALIPALLKIDDGGDEILDGVTLRILLIRPPSNQSPSWNGKLWVNPLDHSCKKFSFHSDRFQILVRIRDLQFEKKLQFSPAVDHLKNNGSQISPEFLRTKWPEILKKIFATWYLSPAESSQ